VNVSVCTEPGCPELVDGGGRCEQHRLEARRSNEARRLTVTERGYGPAWRKRRARYLAAHPTCALCGAGSQVPDHHPRTRRELVAAGVPDPDADEHLRPLCTPCHNRATAQAPRPERRGRAPETPTLPPRAPARPARYASPGLR
jgi:5-methylcytosine-specific restriction enzyme A